ncbi:MAG: TldD/PmbA family protein [Candidatus Heimdallarchaeota archaeon]|nr:TldD/PmbA family protein [Candidatus Heimdallarchaeota archaeon]
MIDNILKGLEFGKDLNTDFIDIRFQNKYESNYQSNGGDLSVNTGSRQGFATRVLYRGAWGFASTTSTELKDLKNIIKEAMNLAKGSVDSIKEKVKLAEVKSHVDKITSPYTKSLLDITVTDKINMIKEAEKIFKEYEEIKNYILSYREIIDHRIFANSEGTQIEQLNLVPTVAAQGIASRETKIVPYHEAWSKSKGLELLDEHPLTELAKFVSETATKNLDASLPPGGPTKVVIDHTSVGIIAHEAIGHCSEADLVDAGSFLKGKLGERVCSELISIIDTPVLDDAAGWLVYDDEGTKGEVVEIIKDGVFTGYLNNREYAAKMNMKPTGNARAFTFQDEPLVRMRNTYIKPGDMTDEELFEVVKDGLFVTGMMNGSADTSGEFMVGTGQAFEIKNGKLTDKIFIGPTMSGNAFEMLSSTLGVGNELKLNIGTGFCGKEQPAKVDAGGGRIAVTVILGGQ